MALTWEDVNRRIARNFPDVPTISTDELAGRLDGDGPVPVLLDARAAGEFGVSHLLGARLAASADDALLALAEVPETTLVVVYCSVGYRSAVLARELLARGRSGVYNLDGSIFRWANEGRPVYRDGEPVGEVHPYDSRWGQLLDARYHPEGGA